MNFNSQSKTAYLKNENNYTYFIFKDLVLRFLTPKNLEKYCDIILYDEGYIEVKAKNKNSSKIYNEYIDLEYIFDVLKLNKDILKEIKGVKIL